MEQKVVRTKRTKTADQALQSLMRECARSERSSGDALRLMKRWGVSDEDAQKVLARLLAERFIDDSRYAEAFVRDKLNLSGWGAYKIKSALRAKGVSKEIIDEVAAQMIEAADMCERLEEIMVRRLRTLKYSSPYDAKTKLIRFAASRGYDLDQAIECATKITRAEEF
ncbi:MAG: RecX family transcriptional regulator [Alistipes sp.]|nr:RecX family transcriptional regulator [Alistipes sp.]